MGCIAGAPYTLQSQDAANEDQPGYDKRAPNPDLVKYGVLDLKESSIWRNNKFRFRLWIWSIDDNIDLDRSWARCTFRPAHNHGVAASRAKAYPFETGRFQDLLKGFHLSEMEDMPGTDPSNLGMITRQYSLARRWPTSRAFNHGYWLTKKGKFEIAVQVGLYQKGVGEGVFFEVDPEMDLGPD